MYKKILKAQIENIKAELKCKEFALENKEKELKEIDQEKSEAEEYAQSVGLNRDDWNGIYFDRLSLKYAYEAGQAHAHDIIRNQPAQEEKQEIIATVFDFTWSGAHVKRVHFILDEPQSLSVNTISTNQKYKLTPIED